MSKQRRKMNTLPNSIINRGHRTTQQHASHLSYLNDHCLLVIFGQLPTKTLLHLCDTDERMYGLVQRYIVPFRMFNLDELSTVWRIHKLFKMFGKQMYRIMKRGAGSFTHFLELFVRYCEPDQLHELHLAFNYVTFKQVRLIDDALPYFRNLKKLTLESVGPEIAATKLVAAFSSSPLPNVTALTLIDVAMNPQLSRNSTWQNLEDFLLVGECEELAQLIYFVQAKRELKTFCFAALSGVVPNIGAFLQSHSSLEAYSTFDFAYRPKGLSVPIFKEYVFAGHLPSIKHLSLTLYTGDGSDIVLALAPYERRNTLETLNILMNSCNTKTFDVSSLEDVRAIAEQWLSQLNGNAFSKVTNVGLWIELADCTSKSLLDLEYVFKFLFKLSNLKSITIRSTSHVLDLYCVAQKLPHIQSLRISDIKTIGLPEEMRQIDVVLAGTNRQNGNAQPFQLIVNERQHTELMVNAN